MSLRPRVLVVEDFAILGKTLKELLELEGFDAELAFNGKEALSVLENGERPDVILMDLKMPIMSGAELLERLKADQRFEKIPVVAISAASNRGGCMKADHFLKKPLDTEELIRVLWEKTPATRRSGSGSSQSGPKPH
jgi:CheY-like chemotaxis protein